MQAGRLFVRSISQPRLRAIRRPMYSASGTRSSRSIDLRSDTVTRPCDEMRRVMAQAEVGDDVYGEDPTVNRLQETCASLFGKEAALFVPSGTMGNLIAVLSHCQRGDEIIVGKYSHIHRWEQGNYAQFGGISASTTSVNERGELPLDEIKESIRGDDCHLPITRLICIENTHNYAGGKPLSIEYLREVRGIADAHGLNVHMDGARVFNAAVALGVTVADIAAAVDSVMMCFSKGIGAPLGSILVGSKDFIATAHRKRKALGGGMRQAGVAAAAAEWGLQRAMQTTAADHRRALRLAVGINAVAAKSDIVADESNTTNIVLVRVGGGRTPDEVVSFLAAHEVLGMAFDGCRVRLVVHRDIDDAAVEKTIDAFRLLVASQ